MAEPCIGLKQFWRFTELHYSQTIDDGTNVSDLFWRFTELHYSQTKGVSAEPGKWFWRFTELHYSQTVLSFASGK